MSRKNLPYRLALSLGYVPKLPSMTRATHLALAHAVIKLQPEIRTGTGVEPITDGVAVVDAITYTDPADMLTPMPLKQHRQKIAKKAAELGAVVNYIPFDKLAYNRWLGNRRDTHEHRAQWAAHKTWREHAQ